MTEVTVCANVTPGPEGTGLASVPMDTKSPAWYSDLASQVWGPTGDVLNRRSCSLVENAAGVEGHDFVSWLAPCEAQGDLLAVPLNRLR